MLTAHSTVCRGWISFERFAVIHMPQVLALSAPWRFHKLALQDSYLLSQSTQLLPYL